MRFSNSNNRNGHNFGLILRSDNIEFFSTDAISGPLTFFELASQFSIESEGELSASGCISFDAWPTVPQAAFYQVTLNANNLSPESEEVILYIRHDGTFSETSQGRFSDLNLTLVYRKGEGISMLPGGKGTLHVQEEEYPLEPQWDGERGLVFQANAEGKIQVGTLGEARLKKVTAEPFDRWSNLQLLYAFSETSGSCVYDSSKTGEPMTLVARRVILPKGCLAPFQANKSREKAAAEHIDPKFVDEGIALDGSYYLEPQENSTKLMRALRATNAMSFELWIKPQKSNPYAPAQIFEITGRNNRNWLTVCQGQKGGSNTFISMDIRQGAVHKNWKDPFQSAEYSLPEELTQVIFTQSAAGNACIYINGKLVAKRQQEPRICDWEDDFKLIIGRHRNNKDTVNWDGEIHHLSFYDRAFTAEEVCRRYEPILDMGASFTLHKVPAPLRFFEFDAQLVFDKDTSSISVQQEVSLDIRPNLGFEAVQMQMEQTGDGPWQFSSVFNTRMWDSIIPLNGYLEDGPFPEKIAVAKDDPYDGLPRDEQEPDVDAGTMSKPGPTIIEGEVIGEHLLELRSQEAGTVVSAEIESLGSYDFKDVVLKAGHDISNFENLIWDLSSQPHLGYTAIPSLLPRNTAIDTDFKLIRPRLIMTERDISLTGQWLGNQLDLFQEKMDGQSWMVAFTSFEIPFSLSLPAPVHEYSGVTIGRNVTLSHKTMKIEMDLRLQTAGFLAQVTRQFDFEDAYQDTQWFELPSRNLYLPPASRNELLAETLDEISSRIADYFSINPVRHQTEQMKPEMVLQLLGKDREFNLPGKFLEESITLHTPEGADLLSFSSWLGFSIEFSHTIPAPIHAFSGVRIGRDIMLDQQSMNIEMDFTLQKEGFLGKLRRDFTFKEKGKDIQAISLTERRLYESPHSRNDLLEDILTELTEAIDSLFDEHRREHEISFINPNDPLLLLGMDKKALPGKFLEEDITIYLQEENGERVFVSKMPIKINFSHKIPAPIHKASGTRVGKDITLDNRPMDFVLSFRLLKEGFRADYSRSFTYEGAGSTHSLKLANKRIYVPPHARNDLLDDTLADLTAGIESLFASNRSELEANFFDPVLPLELLGKDANGKLTGKLNGEEVDLSTLGSGTDITLLAKKQYTKEFSHIIPAPIHEFSGIQIGEEIVLDKKTMIIDLEYKFVGEDFQGTLKRKFEYRAGKTLTFEDVFISEPPVDIDGLVQESLDDLSYHIETLYYQQRSLEEKNFLDPAVALDLLGLNGGKIPGIFLDQPIELTPIGDLENAEFSSTVPQFASPFLNSIPAPIHDYSGMQIGQDINLAGKQVHFDLDIQKIGPGEFTAALDRSFEYPAGKVRNLAQIELSEAPSSQDDLVAEIMDSLSFQIANLLVTDLAGFEDEVQLISNATALELLGQGADGKLTGKYLEEDITLTLTNALTGSDWHFEGTINPTLKFDLDLPAIFDDGTGARLSKAVKITNGEIDIELEARVEVEDYLGILKKAICSYTDDDGVAQSFSLPNHRLYVPPASQNALLGELLDLVVANAGSLFAEQGANQLDYYLNIASATAKPQIFLSKDRSSSREGTLTTIMPALFPTNDPLTTYNSPGSVFSLTQSADTSTLTLSLASKQQASIKTDYDALMTHLALQKNADGTEKALPGAIAMLKRRIAERLPMEFDRLLYYYYGWDMTKGCIDLEGGMRLRVDLQNYQFVQPTDQIAERGFVGSGSMHLLVNSYTYPQSSGGPRQLLGFGPFVSQLQTNFQNEIETKGAGGVFDLLKTGNRMPYFRLFYPKQPSIRLGPERMVTIVGANSLDDILKVTADFDTNGSALPGKGSSFFFRGQAMIVPEIQVFVGKVAVYVPIGTTLRQLIEMFDSVPAAALPGQNLTGFGGISRPMRIIHEGLTSQAEYRFINLNATGSGGGYDALDLPLVKGDRFVF